MNDYRKFEKIIFTNNKDMSVWTRIDDAFYTWRQLTLLMTFWRQHHLRDNCIQNFHSGR